MCDVWGRCHLDSPWPPAAVHRIDRVCRGQMEVGLDQ